MTPILRPLSPAARHSHGVESVKAPAAGDPLSLQDIAHPKPKLYLVQPAAHDPPIETVQEIAAQIIAENPLEEFCRREGIALKREGPLFVGLCPFHDENTPSFKVFPDNHFHCFGSGCGKHGDIINLYQDLHECDFKETCRHFGHDVSRLDDIVAIYPYVDEKGNELSQILRKSYPKRFLIRHKKADGTWDWSKQGVRIVPYHLDEIITSDEIWIVEGEKDADTLRKLHLVATCNPFGGEKWRSEFAQYFQGKSIYICPDTDEPGRKHCLQVGQNLLPVAKQLQVVTLPKGFKDVTELFENAPNSFEERLREACLGAKPFADFQHGPNGEKGEFDFSPYDERKFNMAKLHEKPVPIFMLKDQPIATPGNIVALYAQAKAGKSAVISAMMATILSEEDYHDFLGFSGGNNEHQFAVIHLDTEQSRYDHEQVVIRALRRADKNSLPPWLRSYCLTDLDIASRRIFISKELERACQEHKGIFCALIDGVGDFVLDVNDIADPHSFIVELHGLAITYNCVLILVLHENPGTGKMTIEKMRGHLGSQLERKAESNIRIIKESDGDCVIYTEKSRHANIPREHGHHFAWDDKASTHLSSVNNNANASLQAAERHFVEAIFNCPNSIGGFSYSALHERIRELGGYKPGSERKRFAKLLKLNLIEKNDAGFYRANL